MTVEHYFTHELLLLKFFSFRKIFLCIDPPDSRIQIPLSHSTIQTKQNILRHKNKKISINNLLRTIHKLSTWETVAEDTIVRVECRSRMSARKRAIWWNVESIVVNFTYQGTSVSLAPRSVEMRKPGPGQRGPRPHLHPRRKERGKGRIRGSG